jgi:hypothetical protein
MTTFKWLSPPSRWGVVRRAISLWIVVFLAFGPAASAATYFVSTTGSDTATGLSGSPWRTITHALAIAVSGDIVNVAAGTYNQAGGEVFPINLTSGVTLQGPAVANPVTTSPTAIVNGTGFAPVFTNNGALSNTTLVKYFKFENYDAVSNFENDIFYFDATAVTQRPGIGLNEFVGHGLCCSAAIRAQGSGSNPGGTFDATISNNYIHNFYYGISLEDSGFSGPMVSLSPTISGNTFTNNNYGINLSATEVNLNISNGATAAHY